MGEPFDRFLQMLGLMCAQLPCISVINLTWFALQITELLLRNRASVIYLEFFRAPYRKNYALNRKRLPPFRMVSPSSTTAAKSGEDRTTRVGCRCENMVFICLSRCEAGTLLVRGGILYCVAVYESILILFSLFLDGIVLSVARDCLFSSPDGATILSKLLSKMAKKRQKSAEKFVSTTL